MNGIAYKDLHKLQEIEEFITGIQMIQEDHIKLMQPEKIKELLSKAAHYLVMLKISLEVRL